MSDHELRQCPKCKTQDYVYAHSVSQLFTETLDEVKDVRLSKLPGVTLLREFMGFLQSAIRTAVDGTPETPGLLCKHCRSFVIVCPKCWSFSMAEKRPATGQLVQCSECYFSFMVCERSDEFDKLLGKKTFLIKLIQGAITGIVIFVVLMLVLMLFVSKPD